MLDSRTIKKISDFVYTKPRTVQEIAHHIQKNWRTANSYVDRIAEETGQISTRVFREGTKGALKIAYWSNIERIHSTTFQEKLFKRIESGKKKEDFSPFDIYQYVDDNKRKAFVVYEENEGEGRMIDLWKSAENFVLIFSGNLSWINLSFGKIKIKDVLESVAKRNVQIKIVTRVDLATLSNLKKIIEINEKIGRENIEVRHCEQPLRGMIVDNKIVRLREIKEPEHYKKGELEKRTYVYYEIFDEDWINWIQKVFYNFFRTSICAKKRTSDMETLEKWEQSSRK